MTGNLNKLEQIRVKSPHFKFCLTMVIFVGGIFSASLLARAQGIPEPSLLFYGTIRNTAVNNLRMVSGNLSWQIRKTSSGRTITLNTPVTNYPGFSYLLEVPAESIVSGAVTTNVLDLSGGLATYAHQQLLYNGSPVSFMVATQTTFSASSATRGRIQRIDLTVAIPCNDFDGNGLCDDWELQYFGYIGVDPNADDDHDGMSNRAEYLAGTDPLDPNSKLQFINFKSVGGGAMRVDWESSDGRSYRLWRGTNVLKVISTNLAQVAGLTLVRSNIVATPPSNTLIDSNTVPTGTYFYRVELEQ